ncbi:DUF2194 domain-containing protein [Clostridium aestuarii]|uniref:DUF2194 domain-containing protein n=1 Tax=Clostridium aestuarii TaxID=338193 RepID=A0ABT4CVB1_9CLOT|nr:DUF2194 domain-containing protein [Clostridium aestuarii]MCY6482928.1 DUF2194 domain-containing protein [Clostridium aestuarii]
MYKKNMFFSLSLVFLLAVFYQCLRSDIFIKFIRNTNDYKMLNSEENTGVKINVNKEKYLVIYDKTDTNSIYIKNNVIKVIENMKKDYTELSVEEYENNDLNYDGVIFAFERMDYLKNIDNFIEYSRGGGSLLFMERPVIDESFKSFYKELGISSLNDLINSYGIKLLSNVLVGAKEFEINDSSIENSSLDLKLSDDTKIYIESYDKLPLLWSKNLDKGKIIFFNGTMLNEKINRGLITGILSLSKEEFIYPVINMKLLYIDDFPAPVPEGVEPNIYKEFGRNIPKFYREIWWADMIAAAAKYDVKYTGLIIETYNDKVKSPFVIQDTNNRNDLIIYGRELLKNGGEIGIHGYNHQSFAYKGYIKQNLGYNSWDNKVDMIKSLQEVMRYAKEVYPKYNFRVYVPPSNILSPEGRQAVIEAMPNIKIISSVYMSDAYGDSYCQEFEISADGIIEMPRFTSGYEKKSDEMWSIYNGVTSLGVFSHFVHPDDVLDYDRNNGKGWTKLYEEFTSLLKQVKDKYSWLRSMNASTGGEEVKKYLQCDPYIAYDKDIIEIYCESFRKNTYFILRSEKEILKSKGCDVNKIDEGVYLICLKEAYASINIEKE